MVRSEAAQRVRAQLKHDPLLLLFDATVKEELTAFSLQREKEVEAQNSPEPPLGGLGEANFMLSLRIQAMAVQRKDRREAVAELIYLMVCSRFKLMDVPLLMPLKHGVDSDLSGQGNRRLWGLTDIYSLEALELVRDHLLRMFDTSRSAARDGGTMRLPLFQAGQMYTMSMLFGYYLRRVDARYQLEKLVGTFSNASSPSRDDSAREARPARHQRPVPDWMNPSWTKGEARAQRSLADYIGTFGPEELRQIRTIASSEAQVAMEAQVSALFGNLRDLKKRLLGAVGRVSSNEELSQKLRAALESGKVESVQLTGEDFRRLVLESVAFGSLLSDAEMEANTVYELAPLPPRAPYGTLG